MIKNKVKVSKFLSFILRHKPQDYGLHLDKHGFTDFNKVSDVLKNKFSGVKEEDVKYIVDTDPNNRFQIKGETIRARYGHSVEVKPMGDYSKIPDVLYHGTSPQNAKSILKEGLKPIKRKFVHLSSNEDDALRVGKRKAYYPVILAIDSKIAESDGIRFWREGRIFLTKEIPLKYISLYK